MPRLVLPVLPDGTFSAIDQPAIENLRPWRDSDVPVVLEAFNGPEIQQWHVRRIDGEGEAHDWIAQWSRRWSAEDAASWAITGADDVAVGQAGLRSINLADGTVGLSYWVLPSARGRGLAPAAVRTLEAWCFALGFHRLAIKHSTRNLASCRVAEKSGYQLEGTLRSAWLHTDGRHDVHVHAHTRPT